MNHLIKFKDWYSENGSEAFFLLDECIRREYSGPINNPVSIKLPDRAFSGEMTLDLGNCPVRFLQMESPHTDDSTLVIVKKERIYS